MRFGSHPVWRNGAAMTAAPARLAVLDKHTPASELAAHGEVAINGHADDATPLTKMGPPRPRV